MAGDWRQILPVVRLGLRPQKVHATLKSSYLWDRVRLLTLTRNMRVQLTGESTAFSDNLLSVRNGQQNVCKEIGNFAMPLPEEITVSNEQDLLNVVFDNSSFGSDPEWLASRSIIIMSNQRRSRQKKNDVVMRFFFSGEGKIYQSSDSVKENAHQYPIEFINLLRPSGMPPYNLTLKKIALSCFYGTWTPQMVTVMEQGTSASTYINMSLMLSSHVDHMQGRRYSSLKFLSYQLKMSSLFI